jgi:hypothetical protein
MNAKTKDDLSTTLIVGGFSMALFFGGALMATLQLQHQAVEDGTGRYVPGIFGIPWKFVGTNVRAEAVRAGVARYSTDLVTGERRFEWAKIERSNDGCVWVSPWVKPVTGAPK